MYYFKSDTTGEKDFEEFYTGNETLEMEIFDNIGIIKNGADFDDGELVQFTREISRLRTLGLWTRADLIGLFNKMIPEFNHKEMGKFLDSKM